MEREKRSERTRYLILVQIKEFVFRIGNERKEVFKTKILFKITHISSICCTGNIENGRVMTDESF